MLFRISYLGLLDSYRMTLEYVLRIAIHSDSKDLACSKFRNWLVEFFSLKFIEQD